MLSFKGEKGTLIRFLCFFSLKKNPRKFINNYDSLIKHLKGHGNFFNGDVLK